MRLAVLFVAACHAPVVAPVPVAAVPPAFVADGTITPALAMILEGRVLVDPAVTAPDPVDAVLDSGAVREIDPACESDPPDYEKENGRYFACKEPSNAQEWTAKGVSKSALPKVAAWKGRDVAVYGPAGVLCEGRTVGDSGLIGAWRTNQEAVMAGIDATDPGALAGAVLKHNAALVTSLTAACVDAGEVVRDKHLPPMAMWTMRPANKEVIALVTTAISELPDAKAMVADQPSALKVVVARPADRGHVLVIASLSLQSCNGDQTIGGIWELTDGELHQLTLTTTEHDEGEFAPRLVADSDGNGWPELVTSRGIHVGTEDGYAYTPWVHFDDVFDGPWCGD